MIIGLSFLLIIQGRAFSEDLKWMLEEISFGLVQGGNQFESHELEQRRKRLGIDLDVILEILLKELVHALLLLV